MVALINSRIMRIVPLLIAVCLVGISSRAKCAGSSVAASAETSTYVFVPDQSTVVQTGGIASVHWTYSVKGEFQLTVYPNAGSSSFTHVDANATDDSPFKRTLDLNHAFNMTSLLGTVEPNGSIQFTGKALDGSDILIMVTFQDDLANLIGQTTPPPNSADFFIFSLDAVSQFRKYGGGSGTAEDPYKIATAADLLLLGDSPGDYGKHFILTADIDLDPNLPGRKVFDKAVIAPSGGRGFNGVFEGNGHTISHMTLAGDYDLGLFGWFGPAAKVRDLGVVDVYIMGSGHHVGALVGSNGTSEKSGGRVTGCYSSGTVSGSDCVGSLVGWNSGYVTQCYSTATVRGSDNVGGLVGLNYSSITTSYSTGAVTGTGLYVGGLVGVNHYRYATISASFWDTQTSGQTNSDGGTGKTTAEMQRAKTFLDSEWDFINIWGIGENQTYPYLRKYSAADINQDASVNFLDLAALAENWLTGVAP